MRPKSIRYFEQIYFASLALEIADMLLFEIPDPEMGWPLSIFVIGLTLAITLALWFCVAVRASKVAMWIYVALVPLSVLLIMLDPEAFAADNGVSIGLNTAAMALDIGAVYFLLRADARRWFATRGVGEVDPNIFT